MTQKLLNDGTLNKRHVQLQALEAFVGTLGGAYLHDHIPWSRPAQIEGKQSWMLHGPSLDAYASFASSLLFHGGPKSNTLLRGESFERALGNPLLINGIWPSQKHLQEQQPAPHYETGPRRDIIATGRAITLGLPRHAGSVLFRTEDSIAIANSLSWDGFMLNQGAMVYVPSGATEKVLGGFHGPDLTGAQCKEIMDNEIGTENCVNWPRTSRTGWKCSCLALRLKTRLTLTSACIGQKRKSARVGPG